jgi:hypothetical protein
MRGKGSTCLGNRHREGKKEERLAVTNFRGAGNIQPRYLDSKKEREIELALAIPKRLSLQCF